MISLSPSRLQSSTNRSPPMRSPPMRSTLMRSPSTFSMTAAGGSLRQVLRTMYQARKALLLAPDGGISGRVKRKGRAVRGRSGGVPLHAHTLPASPGAHQTSEGGSAPSRSLQPALAPQFHSSLHIPATANRHPSASSSPTDCTIQGSTHHLSLASGGGWTSLKRSSSSPASIDALATNEPLPSYDDGGLNKKPCERPEAEPLLYAPLTTSTSRAIMIGPDPAGFLASCYFNMVSA